MPCRSPACREVGHATHWVVNNGLHEPNGNLLHVAMHTSCPLIQLNKFWTRSGSVSLQTSMLMPLCTILRTRTLSQTGTWRRSPGLQVELSRISSYIVAWRERPPKILYWESVTSWLVVVATQEWIEWGRRWRVHWRQVDVVCERASGIPCVCVVLLEGVGCMRVGRLGYWCT